MWRGCEFLKYVKVDKEETAINIRSFPVSEAPNDGIFTPPLIILIVICPLVSLFPTLVRLTAKFTLQVMISREFSLTDES
jgi:hypothetical protein